MLREDPERLLNLIRGNFQTHDPTWADIESHLNVLLTGEEKATIFSKAQEEADKKKETMRVIIFSDGGIKWCQIMNPAGTTETMENGVEDRG